MQRRRAANPRGGRRPADRAVRSFETPHVRIGPAHLRCRADGAQCRLCRAALYVRRPRAACARRRYRSPCGLGRLSRADAARRRPPAGRSGRALRALVQIFPVGRLAHGRPALLDKTILPALRDWAKTAPPEAGRALSGRDRLRFSFGTDGSPWDEEKTLERYELLYSAGLVEEAQRDGREAALKRGKLVTARRSDAARSPAHSRHRHRAAARQDEIPARSFSN
jgi:hypothetical protein